MIIAEHISPVRLVLLKLPSRGQQTTLKRLPYLVYAQNIRRQLEQGKNPFTVWFGNLEYCDTSSRM